MLIRQFEYLAALAREQHFARAALACHVSQPALSAGIRKLEAELDVPIVRRGNRFEGFTPEGERVLGWAYRILAERDALAADVETMREGHTGLLRIGVVPSAMSAVALITAPFGMEHPRVRMNVMSMSSREIHRGMAEFDLDVGVTYLDGDMGPSIRRLPLYQERYVLLTSSDGRFAGRGSVSWAEIAHVPLCLLSQDMQNRRTIDEVFRKVGASPVVKVETNSVSSLCAHVREGGWFSILSHAWLQLFGVPEGMRAVPMVDPDPSMEVGLVVPERDPESILVRELFAFSRGLGIQARLDELLPGDEVPARAVPDSPDQPPLRPVRSAAAP